jgi:hypothetical protein
MITSSVRRRDAVGNRVPSLRRQSYCLCLTPIDSKSQESGSEMCASKVFDLLDIGISLWIFDSCVHCLSVQFFKTNRFHPTQLYKTRRIFPIKSPTPPPSKSFYHICYSPNDESSLFYLQRPQSFHIPTRSGNTCVSSHEKS